MSISSAHEHFTALMTELGWEWDGTQPQPEQRMLLELCVAVEDALSQVERKAEQVTSDAERVISRVKGHRPSLNTLGELQGTPAALEAGVGAFHAAQHLLDAFMKCYRTERERTS